MLYLGFTEAITQNCSSFIWKGLGLRDRRVLQNTYLWYNITISACKKEHTADNSTLYTADKSLSVLLPL